MTTQISADNIQPSTLASISGGPKITNIQVTNSSYVVIDDTAVALTGGYIKITGSGFASGCTVIINGTAASSVSFVSSSVLNVQVGPQSAGTYIVYVTNTDGSTAIRVNGITYSGTPTWVTGSTLPQAAADSSISIQLSATGDTPMTYVLQAGSSLPTGLTLTSGGLLSGTITGVSVETIYNFTIEAIDPQSQESPRAFSITITVGDTYWKYVTTLLSASSPTTLPFNDDASTNNFAIAVNGDIKPFNSNPYTPGYYSNYFDGTGDYLQVAGSAAACTGFTGDFTIEGWIYTGSTSNIEWASTWVFGSATTSSWIMALNFGGTGKPRFTYGVGSTNTNFDSTGTITFNAWNHIAVTRSGTTVTIWINGVSSGTTTVSGTLNTSTNPVQIGAGYTTSQAPANYFTGYVSNFRVVKGTAIYTTAFAPPTAPLTAVTNTQLLTCQSNRFIDNSTNNFTITKNGDTSINSFVPYLPNSSYSTYGSAYFDGSNDSLSTPTGPTAFDFSTTKTMTLEFWAYVTTWGGTYTCFFDIQEGAPFRFMYLGGTLYWQGNAGNTNVLTGSITLATNTWYHYAFVRNNDSVYIFVNGEQVATGSYTSGWGTTATGFVRLGTNRGDTWFLNGYMADVRLVKGSALYTSAFTPPSTPLTAISGTSLLTCRTNQPVSNNTFLDKSTFDFSIAKSGNTTQGTFSPYGENWSVYFDGTSSFASPTTHTIYASASQDFTFECWFNASSLATHNMLLGWNQTPWDYISIRSTGYELNMAGSYTVAGTVTWSLNTWYHFAVSRVSNSVKVFINGQLSTTVTNSNSIGYGTVAAQVGNWFSTPAYYWKGYISNMRWIRGTGIYTSTFTPSTTPLTAISNTTLLTCASVNVVDNSPNNYTFTRTGSVTVQKFGPFPGTSLPTPYYGAYFDGTSDYLSTATSSALTIGTNQFTVELWVYHKAAGASEQYLDSASSGFSLSKNTSNQLVLSQSGVSVIFTSTGTITAGQWNHIAIVRNASNVATMYINGTAGGTATVTTNFSTNYFYIGRQQAVAAAYLNGYVSNVRIVVGAAVYTANFTPPSSPLTAITNTQLLTCQSNSFIDNSSNNIVITSNGSVRPTTFNPFTVTYSAKQSYTPSVYGGSMYFDGTGDYVTVSTLTPATALSSGDWTFECWFYTSATKAFAQIIGNRSGASGSTAYVPIVVSYESATIKLYSSSNGSSWNISNAGTIGTVTLQSWNHVAVVRNGNNLEAYLNGTKVTISTGLSGISYTATNLFYASGANDPFAGYISDVRLVTGTALYTSNFVPPNAPLTAIKNSVLLLNGTSAGIYDSSEMNNFETVGDAKLSTTTVKFSGSTSMYFDGTGDYLYSPANPNFAFGSGNFTVECWFYLASSNSNQCLIDFRSGSTSTVGFFFGIVTSGYIQVWNNANIIYYNAGITTGTWYHVALVRNSTTMAVYLNGTSVATATNSTNFTDNICRIGSSISAVENLNGYLSDLRITKGYARYTANFTPPTDPFPAK